MADTSIQAVINISPDLDIPLSQLSNIQTTNNNNDIANSDYLIIDINEDSNEIDQFITLEHNINILDGSLQEYNTNIPKYGYWSNDLSDDNCKTNNKIKISFNNQSNDINIYGLLINFSNTSYISHNVLAYQLIDNNEYTKYFSPNSIEFREFLDGKNIKNITINFKSTKFPRMFSRINNVSFDLSYIFDKSDIISCNFNEELSPISQILSPTTCTINIYSSYKNFDITLPYGISSLLNKNYICTIISHYHNNNEDYNNKIHDFYISNIEGTEEDNIQIKLVSLIGKLSNYVFTTDSIINGDEISLIQYILKDLDIQYSFSSTNFENTNQLREILLPNGNVRTVLQQFLFSIYATVDDTDNELYFFRISNVINNEIFDNMLIDYPKLSKINGNKSISVTYYSYEQQSFKYFQDLDCSTIYEGTITADGIELIFDKPSYYYMYAIQDKNGNYINNSITYNVFDNSIPLTGDIWNVSNFTYTGSLKYKFVPNIVSSINLDEVKFIIKINHYIENKSQYNIYSENTSNAIEINNKILNNFNVSKFSNNIYEYYNKSPYKIEFTYLWNAKIRVGDTVYIHTDYQNYLRATIVKQSIDLSNGFISKAVAIGDIINPYETNYMSDGYDGQYDIIMDDNIQI